LTDSVGKGLGEYLGQEGHKWLTILLRFSLLCVNNDTIFHLRTKGKVIGIFARNWAFAFHSNIAKWIQICNLLQNLITISIAESPIESISILIDAFVYASPL
jgi:uncharacterized membrane protein